MKTLQCNKTSSIDMLGLRLDDLLVGLAVFVAVEIFEFLVRGPWVSGNQATAFANNGLKWLPMTVLIGNNGKVGVPA